MPEDRLSTPVAPGKRTMVQQLPAPPSAAAPDAAASRSTPGELFDQATRGSPSPLPYRAEMEAVFGTDFSAVRAHLGRGADMARLGAHGAAVGEDVVFATAAPDQRLVAHELTHVVQARRGGRRDDRQASHLDDPAEAEARAVATEAERALAGGTGAQSPQLASRIQPAPSMSGPSRGAGTPDDRGRELGSLEPAATAQPIAARGNAAPGEDGRAAPSGTLPADEAAESRLTAAVSTTSAPTSPAPAPVSTPDPTAAPQFGGDPSTSAGASSDTPLMREPHTVAASSMATPPHAAAASTVGTPPEPPAAPTATHPRAAASSSTAIHARAAATSSAKLAQPATSTPPPRVRAPINEALVALDGVTASTLGPALGAVDRSLHHDLLAAHTHVAQAASSSSVATAPTATTGGIAQQPAAATQPHAMVKAAQPAEPTTPTMQPATPTTRAADSPMPMAQPVDSTRPPQAAHAPAPPTLSAAPRIPSSPVTASAPWLSPVETASSLAAWTPAPALPATQPVEAPASAGPRPRVALVGESAPERLDLRQHHGTARLDGHIDHAQRLAASPPPAERASAPPSPSRLPPPVARAPLPTGEPRFLADVPPQRRPAIEAKVTPVIQGRVREVQARAAEAQSRHDAAQAALDAGHQARQAELASQRSAVRARGDAEASVTQQTWQLENQRIHTERQRKIDAHRVDVQTRVGTLATKGDREVDTEANHAETDASSRIAAARSQADAIVADGRARAAAARASANQAIVQRDAVSSPNLQDNGSGNGADAEADARQRADDLLRQVMLLIEDMLVQARDHNRTRVAELRQQIAQLLSDNGTTIDQLVDDAIGQFPVIATYYKTKLDQTLDAVDASLRGIDWALTHDKDDYATHQLDLIAAAAGELDGMLSDVISISASDNITDLATKFGLTFNALDRDGDGDFNGQDLNGDGDVSDPGEGESWSSSNRQIATLGAILTERAFRGAATGGQLGNLGFGQAFQALMGPIDMNIANGSGGAQTFLRDGQYDIDWYRGVSNERYGNDITDHLGLGDSSTFDIAMLFNVIHEFGHVFDGRARAHGRIDTERVEGSPALPADDAMNAVMTLDQRRNNLTSSFEEFPDLFLNFVAGGFAGNAGGRRAETWFRDNLFGDTSAGSIPQDDWGWADIALDRNRAGDSQWATYGTRYWFAQDDEVYIENIASYYGVSHADLAAANGVDTISQIPRDSWVIIPGPPRPVPPHVPGHNQ